MDIKQENVVSDDVALEFLTMKRNSDDVAVKTEIKSETSCTKLPVIKIKCETATCSNNWNVERKIEVEEETLVSDFGSQNEGEILPENPVMKDEKYNVDHELYNKIEIKEEPCWLETETSSVCDDIKDEDFPPVKSSSLCMATFSDDNSDESTLSSVEVSGRNTNCYNVRDHLQCESDLTEVSTAEEHVLLEQSGNCSDRLEMFLRPLHLKLKVLTEKNKKRHTPNMCAKELSHLSGINILIHEGNKTHQCKTCGQSFTQLATLNTHNLIHESKKPHQCTMCDKSFSRLSALKIHNLIHEGKKPHQCKTCDKSFTQLSNLKAHTLIHEGKKPHQCKICGKSFTHLSHLKRHCLIHEGKKPHQCKTCNKSFTHSSSLKTHILIHEGKKPHQCQTCNKSFTQLSALKAHNLIHEGKKPHQCQTCNKSFTQLSNLKTHILIHEGKKPHKCKTCDKRFTQLATLNTHTLIHNGKKSHQCKTCDKSFSRLSILKAHVLVHEGQKSHQCKTCDKSFSRSSTLKAHVLVHEAKNP